jgi:archaellum biogenesis ATPase FlaH
MSMGEPSDIFEAAETNERYGGRLLDVGEMLRAPDVAIPWRCDRFVADGYLTVLAGKGGEGKSWISLALACGVARGQAVAGIDCQKGRALLFDAENGPRLIARRLRAARVTAELAIQPVDAGGLHFQKDLEWFRETIVREKANLVVFDSLRVLSSGVKENDGDAVEPIITALKMLARETETGILLIHHRGKGDSDYRGTSTILDQTDLLFTLTREQGDPLGRRRRKITTVKCRIEEEPMPRWVSIVAERHAGTVFIDEAEPYETDEPSRPRDSLREPVLEVLGGIGQSCRKVAKKVEKPEPTVRRVLHELQDDGLAKDGPQGWVLVRHDDACDDAPGDALCANGGDAHELP